MQQDIFDAARTYGHQAVGAAGAIYYQNLEVSYLLKCLRRNHYDDQPGGRLRRHVLLEGVVGSGKTAAVEQFFWNDLTNALPHEDSTPEQRKTRPTYYIHSGDTTKERVRGGIGRTGDLIPPVLLEVPFLIIGELTDVTSERPDKVSEEVHWMNRAMEEGRVRNGLTRYFDLDEKAMKRAMAQCANLGVKFTATDRVLAFETSSVFWFATHPLSPKMYDIIYKSGLPSRAAIGSWIPDDKEYYDETEQPRGIPDRKLTEWVREFNIKAWNYRYAEVNSPPAHMLMQLKRHYREAYVEINKMSGVSFKEIFSRRDETDMAQLLTASALARALQAAPPIRAQGPNVIERITYSEQDVATAMRLAKPHLAQLYTKFHGRAERMANESLVKEDFAKVLRLIEDPSDRETLTRKQFVELYARATGKGRASADARLRELKACGAITVRSFGSYYVDDDFLMNHGLGSSEVAQRIMEREYGFQPTEERAQEELA